MTEGAIKEYDVAIIGAGLAGLQCAKLLGQGGAKVLLVDRKADLSIGVHTTGIFVRKTLEDFRFPNGTLGKSIKDVTLYSPKLRALPLESEREEFRIGKMQVLYGAFLSDCLENGVEFSSGTRLIGTETSMSETVVTLERNSARFEIKAKVLVGADGVNSVVARSLDLDVNKEWIVGVEDVFRVEGTDREPRLHCFLDARLAPGYLAWIADDGEEVHIGVGGYAEDFRPRKALREFKRKAVAKILNLEGAEFVETRGGRIPVGGVLRRIACENGILIGDAAGAVSPLTAGGLDPCLRLSAVSANVILKRLEADDPRILMKYSGELFRSRFVSRLWMRRIISAIRSQAVLEAACCFFRGRIGGRMARHVFFGRGSFPDVKIERTLASVPKRLTIKAP